MNQAIDLSGLRKAVAKAGSQTKLAKRAGCGQQTISDILHGRRSLTLGIALKVARASGMAPQTIHPELRGSARPIPSETA